MKSIYVEMLIVTILKILFVLSYYYLPFDKDIIKILLSFHFFFASFSIKKITLKGDGCSSNYKRLEMMENNDQSRESAFSIESLTI